MPDESDNKTMDLSQPFTVGPWLVEPSIERISHGDLEEKLEPRVMDVLICLASHPGEVISREELEKQVWAGMVVGYDALTSAMIKLRKAFHDDSRHPEIIQTVSKRGYRLLAEVKPAHFDIPDVASFGKKSIRIFNAAKWYLALVAGTVLILSAVAFTFSERGRQLPVEAGSGTDIPSIIVLPFLNQSDDPDQVYFSDGITEDLITDLSRISHLRVLARNTSFRYKDQVVNPAELGKELDVQYMLEGSVRKAGDQIRINTQLIDTRNGYQVWANRFDRKLDEIFALQDEVTRNIVNALAVKLTIQEEQGLGHAATSNFEAYDLFLQGRRHYSERTKEASNQAQDEFRKAIELDPYFARAYSAWASTISIAVQQDWLDSPLESLNRALDLAKKAVALDSSLPQAYWSLGYVYMFRKEYDKAASAVEQAIAIAPNYADGYGLLALINNRLGNGDRAIELIKKGMKLNPHYSWDYPYNLGRGYYTRGDYRMAITPLKEALNRNEFAVMPRLFLTASYSALGMQEEAEWEVQQVLNTNPAISLSHLQKFIPIDNDTVMQTYLAHLRKAGLPDE
jgi:TolB-like protein/DNA-binding winged helix-turn-helix (wHTH) protein/Tfp pilus assembly protein PilF